MRKITGIMILTLGCIIVIYTTPLDAFQKLPVVVSILPEKYLVERVGGDLVDVEVLIQPGADPHLFEPKPSQMKILARAKIFFALGLPFEGSLLPRLKILNPDLNLIHVDEGIFIYPMETRSGIHGHERSEKENKGSKHLPGDTHIWNSPGNVNRIVRNVTSALVRLDPLNRDIYLDNCFSFLFEVDEIDFSLREMLLEKRGSKFLVFHPAWGYFAREYGLVQVPVEIEGKEAKPSDIQALIEIARKDKIEVVLVSPQFSDKSAQILAREINGRVVKIDPLAENWIENMKKAGQIIREAAK